MDAQLRVMVIEERGRWFAQALETDYFAEGLTDQKLHKNSAEGFSASEALHVKLYGNAKKFPRVVHQRFFDARWGGLRESGVLAPRFALLRLSEPLAA